MKIFILCINLVIINHINSIYLSELAQARKEMREILQNAQKESKKERKLFDK